MKDTTRWGDTRWTELDHGQRHSDGDAGDSAEERRAAKQSLAVIAVMVVALFGFAGLAATGVWPHPERTQQLAMHH